MKSFEVWANHYGYQDTPEARADYARYVGELRQLGRMTAARAALDSAVDYIREMRDVLDDGDGIESFTAAYSDAVEALTDALKHVVGTAP